MIKRTINKIRDRTKNSQIFRVLSHRICRDITRKLKKLFKAHHLQINNIVAVIILRSGMAFLDSIINFFPTAEIGVLGLKRDEKTLEPYWYYENLPKINKESIIIIFDPMLATGGSACEAINKLKSQGANSKNIYFVSIVSAPEGFARVSELIPKENIIIKIMDKKLDEQGMIVPGLGDFGDRYFGYKGEPTLKKI